MIVGPIEYLEENVGKDTTYMMTEEEARKQNLPGSDVFLKTQLAYKDELNRDALIIYLNREAYKSFIDTITISQYPLLKEESKQAIRNMRLFPPTIFQRIEYILTVRVNLDVIQRF